MSLRSSGLKKCSTEGSCDVGTCRFVARTRIPIALTRLATARPISPYPTIPTVCPPISSTSNGSHTPAVWLRTMRRRSFAKYRIAASTNSPNEALNTPLPLVNSTSLFTSSGNKRLSTPAARECIHRTFWQVASAACSSSRVPDHCRITVASFPAWAHAERSPHTAYGISFSIANCGSSPEANTNTGFSFPMFIILPRSGHIRCSAKRVFG